VLCVVVALGLAWLARQAQHRRVERAGHAGWITTDPDSLYQMRRVERVFHEGLPVAGSDPLLAWPEGSPIPWPPYYTLLAWGALAPFAPDAGADGGETLHAWIERAVATLPLVLGLLTVLVAALAGRAVAGAGGAWIAATCSALCAVTVAYSRPGNGDHHAFVSLCGLVVLVVLSRALRGDRLDRPAPSLRAGVLAGLVTGVQLGAWVGALLHVVIVQLVLGWAIVRQGHRPRAGLLPLGLGFHVAAFLAVLPAVLSSPWRERAPWMVVNLSWFHLLFLLAGAAVFVPLAFLRGRRLRAYPWGVAGLLALVTAALVATGAGPGAGLREALEWAGRENAFMTRVRESRSLLEGGGAAVVEALGWGAVLFPLAWIAMAWQAFRRARLDLLPWVVASAVHAAGALRQARFAEPLAIPMAVVLAWGAVRLVEPDRSRFLAGPRALLRALPRPALAALALVAVAAAHAHTLARTWDALRGRLPPPAAREAPARLAARGLAEWLRTQVAPGADAGVLADWSWGHVIEWAAGRPTVATNFGLYVGEESFRAPARFFLCEDPVEAEAQLERRQVEYVLLTSELPDKLNSLVLAVDPGLRSRYVEQAVGSGGSLSPRWFRTMGARLMFDGRVFGPAGAGERPLDFLRLVRVSPLRDPARRLSSASDVSPAGWVWQRVAGARLEAHGKPGDVLQVQLEIDYPGPRRLEGRSVRYYDRVAAGEDGVARLRLPYATLAPNGQGRVGASASWRFVDSQARLEVSERAVLEGETIRLE
jgi:asparagine N-glycosylation enzyme membrane subunit Stt3